ncbi:lysine-sensitive aspartokinase 3 [Paraferrimonas sp. SM1919]|uniref:lysine-sensitive aspartokinase 3 n=1 Tax=Paraferrimonas sp. SM1919 TaxID=2662263 RepID=UPI0013D042C2|nr:lysine-sensitive aspartokinase 3 [Paraferrimonas sp. SM1919]
MEFSVAKFGGTSVADFQSMCRCAAIIEANPQVGIVVLSASSGVTNLLVSLAQGIASQQLREQQIQTIATIQWQIYNNLKANPQLQQQIQTKLDDIAELSLRAATHAAPDLTDKILACGEQCSTILFAELLRQRGNNANAFNACEVIATDSNHGNANVEISAIKQNFTHKWGAYKGQQIIVTQGFIGADQQGQITTLGRGGSDFSAALFAEAAEANKLYIWTDVAGIYTTDPRIAAKAHPISEISFNEAAEMATFGAKVLHPATILPAVRSGTDVFVGSSKAPEQGGTWIRANVESTPTFRALALRKQQTLLNLHSLKMLHAQGFLAEVFATLARHKISVDLITTSEVNVALTLDQTGSDAGGRSLLTPDLLAELGQVCEVTVEQELALVALIGNDIATTPGLIARVFGLLEEFNIRLVCQGASPHNICFLVEEQHAQTVIQKLHHNLFE